MPKSAAARAAMIATPRPVADGRPHEPPSSSGLPVTTPGRKPWNLAYSSTIQAMTWALVFTSGAGMSSFGPMNRWIRSTKVRVRCSSSRGERSAGSQSIAPFAPPYGRSTTAVFHVMSEASARTSSRSTVGW